MSSITVEDRASRPKRSRLSSSVRIPAVPIAARPNLFRSRPPVDCALVTANAAVLWGVTAGVVLIAAGLAWLAHLSVDFSPKLQFNVCVIFVLALSGCFFTFRDFRPRLGLIASSLGQLTAATIALCLLTYAVTGLAGSTPLRDDVLARIDAGLGFHWLDLLRWSDAHPAVAWFAGIAYGSIQMQALLAVSVLGLRRDHKRLQGVVYAYVSVLTVTSMIAFLVPAVGAFAFFDVQPSMHEHLFLKVADIPVADILDLRRGALTTFDLERAKGIISFPSVHAALGVLFMWCFWSVPWLRWPGVAFNAALIAATPLHGSHYLADVLAGLPIGAVSLASAARLHAWIEARRAAPLRAEALRHGAPATPTATGQVPQPEAA